MSTDRTAILLLLLLGAALKFSWLGASPLNGDEPFTLFWATRPWGEFTAMLRTENNPPLYFLLVRAWVALVPWSEAWLRLPSAVFSVLTVWPLYLAARSMGGSAMAVCAGLLFTLNNHQYIYAHELRGYSLLLLLAVVAIRLLLREARGPGWWSAGLLGLVFAGLVWTHFFGWLVIGLCLLCSLVLPELRAARRRTFLATCIAAVAFLPYAYIFFSRAGESIAQGTWVGPQGIDEIWHMIRRWSNQPVVTILLLMPVVVVLVRERLSALALRFGLLWWLVPLVGLWVVQWWVPAYLDRYLLFASPGFYLATAYGLVHCDPGGHVRWLAPVVGVLGMVITFTPWKTNGNQPDRVAAQVRTWQEENAGRPVVVRPFWYKPTLWAHMERSPAPAPWLDPWSERYDDARLPGPLEDRGSFILVYASPATGDEDAPAFPGFHVQADRRCDRLMHVALYTN
jgi:uncharacterized membrane protein